MAKQDLVTVENVKNPAVKRQMTVASAKFNSKKWRPVDSEQAPEVKKKDVNPAAAKPGKIAEPINPLVNVANDDFATISEDKPKKTRKPKNLTKNEDEAA